MSKRLMILNGSNLNLLGVREPHIYGTTTLAALEASCQELARATGCTVSFRQSNHEGQLVDWIHEARTAADAVIINPAGYSFHSVSILDALKTLGKPAIEVHISNLHARDEHHRHSVISGGVQGVICGLGVYGYLVAMLAALRMLDAAPEGLPTPLRLGPR